MRRSLKKMMAVGLTAAMTVGSISFQGLSVNAAGLPTTDGHNKYVNSEVFNVISDDSFGTKELENPLFDKTTGSSDISNLQFQHWHMTIQASHLYGISRKNMIM